MSNERSSSFGWSLRLGKLAGIPLRIHFSFLFVLIWFGLDARERGLPVPLAITFLLLVFGCVVLHELGHALMARRFGVRTREIVLYPIGGIARLESVPGGRAELLIALAGPLVNLAIAVLLGVALVPFGVPESLGLTSPAHLPAALVIANLSLFVFNLVPAFPMDGGRVLRAALSMYLPPERATDYAAAVGQAIALTFGLIGILTFNVIWMLIAAFVFFGASQEAAIQRQLAAIRGRVAREAMITRFETLAPQDPLRRAASSLLETHQEDFPVIDAWQRVVGVLSRARLLQSLASHSPDTAVLEVMERDVPGVGPDTDLDSVLKLLRSRPGCPVMVVDDGRARGMITLDNLAEFIEISRSHATN